MKAFKCKEVRGIFQLEGTLSEQKIEGHRITIILDDEIIKKLRKRQAKMLMGTTSSVTLTKVIKEALTEYLKNN